KEMFSFTDSANVIKSLVQDALQAGLGVDLKNFEQAFQSSIEEKVQFISLRPEATASVCRAYIENNMQQLPQPVKLYTFGPMFRRERPQKGRYRQFYQIDAEVLGGSDAPGIDAELIEMVMTFFDRLGLEGVQLDINSIGDKQCRPKYVELLRAELQKVKDQLGPDSQRRIERSEEHTSELQSCFDLVCRLLLEKKK